MIFICLLAVWFVFVLYGEAHADPFGIIAGIGSALAGVGTAVGAPAGAAAVATGAAVVGSTAASIGTSVASLTRKAPEAKIVAPPSPVVGEQAQAAAKQRIQGLGYKSTILSQAFQRQQQGGGKVKLGQ